MNVRVRAEAFSGVIEAAPSKSFLHRALICAALADKPTAIACKAVCEDVEATADCLRAFGAEITFRDGMFTVFPITKKESAVLHCKESGSTLRFLVPVAASLGVKAEFFVGDGLAKRPIAPLCKALAAHGVRLSGERFPLTVEGRLQAGAFTLPGDMSSQFFSGLLLALPLADAPSVVCADGKLESEPYVDMTLEMLDRFGVSIRKSGGKTEVLPSAYRSPGFIGAHGDWSGAAFWLAAGVMGGCVSVKGLRQESLQGDKAIVEVLQSMGGAVDRQGETLIAKRSALHGIDFDASQNPDLVPVLAVTAAFADGVTHITGASRLKYKESDRLRSVCALILSLGGDCKQETDGLTIVGKPVLQGGAVDSFGDHRIAMSAAIASCRCREPVVLSGAECIRKSYPGFWEDFEQTGGSVCSLSEK